MSIDYKALLEKYMRHVVDVEGVDYVDCVNERWSGSDVKFSDEEAAELQRLSDSIKADDAR
jgi:hypothetical protein